VTITDSESHNVIYNEYIDSHTGHRTDEETVLKGMTVPAGRTYEVTAKDRNGITRAITPSTVAVTCSSMESLVIAADELPTLSPEVPLPRAFEGLQPSPFQISECEISPGDDVADLFVYESISSTALGAQILANKAYLEDFFATYFPDALALAEDGEAVHIEVITEPHTVYDIDGSHTEVITNLKFTVDPQFIGLNNGLSAAGQFSLAKQIYVDGTTPISLVNFQAYPVDRRSTASFTSYEYHLPHATLENLEYEDVDFIEYSAQASSGLEFQLGFIKSRCQDAGAHLLTGFFRDRIVLGRFGDLPFSEWRKTRPLLQNCILKELNKSLRGNYDFIRRKLMDLSGGDDIAFSWADSGMTSFEVGYNGTYECSRDILAELLGEVP
jgi:hypothetical protein